MMACEESNRKCFTFIWKLENVSYSWPQYEDYFSSPEFVVDGISWTLEITFSDRDNVEMCLQRSDENVHAEEVAIDCEFAFLSSDGRVLHSFEGKNLVISAGRGFGSSGFVSRNEVFSARRSDFLPQGTLTVRCRIWKNVGEMSKDVRCFARSRVAVEKRSFLWNIKNFSILKWTEKQTYEIRSISSDKELMSLELFFKGGHIFDELIRVKIEPNFQSMNVATIKLSILDAFKKSVKCFEGEFWDEDVCVKGVYCDCKEFALFLSKRELLENKSKYLPNDVLSLWCECAFSEGIVSGEIEMAYTDCSAVAKKETDKHSLKEANNVPVSYCTLVDNLKSMLNNSWLSDVKLKTKSQTFAAHTFILAARSPVFEAMFSNDMKEKIKKRVDIDDLNDDTVLRLLRYIYSAEVEELDWVSAAQLYEAAEKYQIPTLMDVCSTFLKRYLCSKNACETLVFADLHQNEDLKDSVKDYILRRGGDIINSEAWDQLMETNWKLAAETMRLKFKEQLK